MKNLTKIFMAVAVAMFAFACVTDTTEDLGIEVGKGGGKTQITVSLEESRTQLGDRDADGKYPLYWSAGDQIAINGEASAALAEGGNAAATFSFEKVLTTPYNIVYPASEGENVVNFLAEQPYTVGTFAPKAAPMYGYATTADKAIELNHLTGVLRLAVKGNGEAITSVVFTSELGKIAGPFTVDCTNGTLTAQEGALNTVTVTFAEPLVLGAEATPIYAAVPAGNYGNFAITLHTATDKMTVKFNSTTKPIAKGMVREFKEFTYQANDVEAGGTVFEIDSKDALIEFASKVAGGSFATSYTAAAVVADIDMTGYDWAPIEGFNGFTFDGGKASGYAINGLNAPLFGSTNSIIQNVDLTNVNIASNGRFSLGAVVCELNVEGAISNCHTSGTITANNADFSIPEDVDNTTGIRFAGIVGFSAGDVTNCHNEINITVNQLAKSDTAEAYHIGLGGVVGYSTSTGKLTNCVNGNEAKTTGLIKYLDNTASMLHIPHVGGIVGFRSTSNSLELSNNTNYGAIEFNANAAGNGTGSYESTSIGGITGSTQGILNNNNNHGSITVAGGNIKALFLGGVAGTAKAPTLTKCHNNGAISIKSPVRFWTIIVAGVAAHAPYTVKGEDVITELTNNAPIVIEASTASDAPINSNYNYRIAGVVGYTNRTIQDCENKENGDITLSGNITLLRNDPQSGFNVAGVYAYNSTTGEPKNNINRGDINVYTNVSKHSSLTSTTPEVNSKDAIMYRLDIGGVTSHVQLAPVGKEENFGNITIGKADGTEMSITANGIYIGGVIGQRHTRGVGAESSAVNHGHITVNKGVTLNGFTVGVYIAGCAASNASSTTYYNYSNSGNITINGEIDDKAYIGGIAGSVNGALNGCDNTGNVTVSAAIGNSPYIGGGAGYATGNITSGSNSGTISVSSTITTGTSYVGGYVGQCNGGTEFSEISNTGDVTFSGNSGNNTLALGGAVGSVSIAGAFSNCSNNGVVTLTKGAKANKVHYVGGLIGYSVNSSSYTSCTNSTKQGVEWGVVIHQTSSTTGGGNAKRIGGVIGQAGTTTLNNVSNSAGIYHDGYQLGTAGLSIGGIGGTMGVTTVSGVIENSGNIYYAGRCPKSNFGIAGIFATPGSSTLTGATITNTGDITIEKKFDDFIPTDNGSHRCVCGGITGYAPKELSNATSFCKISILNWRADSGTAANNNFFGLIQGMNTPTNHITNCKVGGTLELTTGTISDEYSGAEEEVNLPGTITVANYAMYLTGDQTFTSAAAKAQSIGVITSADDTTPEYAE